jgi:hemerythrin-like domain-containing protein
MWRGDGGGVLANHRAMDSRVGVIGFFVEDHLRMREQCGRLAVVAIGGCDDKPVVDDRGQFEQLVHYFDIEARNHHRHEEATLFPRLLALPLEEADRKQLMSLVDALVTDHVELDRLWLNIRDEVKTLMREFGQSVREYVRPRMATEVTTFVTLNLHHVNREETGILPLVGSRIGEDDLNNILAEIAVRNAAGFH